MRILNRDTATHLWERLQRLRPDTPPAWGRMNAHQMICHLNDTMRLAMAERTPDDGSTLVSRTLLRWVAFRTPLPWPKNYQTRPEFDQLREGTPPIDFELDAKRLHTALDRFTRAPRDFRFGRHPVFGEMSEWEWMRWAYLHADHHFRQFGL